MLLLKDVSVLSSPSVSITSSQFLQLTVDIRAKIFEYVLTEEDQIKIATFKRRPVRDGYQLTDPHMGLTSDVLTGKRLDQPPSNQAILQTNEQMLREAAPIAHSNEFWFDDQHHLNVFLRTIGSIRKYVKQIELTSCNFEGHWRHGNIFQHLGDMSNLRSLKLSCDMFSGFWNPRGATDSEFSAAIVNKFVERIQPSFKHLKWILGEEPAIAVEDIPEITPSPCRYCSANERRARNRRRFSSGSRARDANRKHDCPRISSMPDLCLQIQDRLRTTLRQALETD